MKIAYFDCSFGAAGDMLLGAFLDAGFSLDVLQEELSKLHLPQGEFQLSLSKVHRTSLLASYLQVQIEPVSHDEASKPGHEHEHFGQPHDHHHHHHEHGHTHAGGERHLSEILSLIENSTLAAPVKTTATRIFQRLGEAESKVHGVPVEDIHFHEVGATDAIVDIVGFAVAFHGLGIEKAYVSALPLGSGTVKTSHGIFPVPGPATLNLLVDAGAPTREMTLGYECLTPTGAAILTTVADAFAVVPAFSRISSCGYGAGTLNPASHPNVVRIMLGEGETTDESNGRNTCNSEIVACLETNLDDCSPQVLAFAAEALLSKGALDVSLTACTMKKGRPGHLLTVLSRPEEAQALAGIIMKETTALGVRSFLCERLTLDRDFVSVNVMGEKIKVKVARDKMGKLINVQPEFDDCKRLSLASGMALKEVIAECLRQCALS
ncbi:MAG: nickel pincer cofactor biosynthesis protein LarC [Candidatus Melainabacteria bacterium]|nr:nickel pincer cofactor biosynthesis protein LarC [Candidatus Melainabacteria bacterium]